MNYRHAYHAGNFADVVKHALLTRLIAYLKRKEKPFRVFDTHAGRGSYSLTSDEAQRTGEHADGVGRLVQAAADVMDDPLLAEYREVLASDLLEDRYPGSPLIARRLLRPHDLQQGHRTCRTEEVQTNYPARVINRSGQFGDGKR